MTIDAQLCIGYDHDLAKELISSQSFICTQHIYTELPKRQEHEFELTTYVKITKLSSLFL